METEIYAGNNERNPGDGVMHPRPTCMSPVHVELLKQFWSEGMTPTSMIVELHTLVPSLTPTECKQIVAHWMWNENLRV